MFDLDQKIEEWFLNLQQNKSISPEDAEELKSHLESSIDDLLSLGLAKEEAFLVAKLRLGDSQMIDAEYTKVNSTFIWRRRFIWLVSGYFLFSAIPSIINIATFPIHYFQVNSLLFRIDFLFGSQILIPYPIFLFALFLLGVGLVYLLRRKGNNHPRLNTLKLSINVIIGIVGVYVLSGLINFASLISLSRAASNVAIVGNAAASSSFLSFSWQFFLLIALTSVIGIQSYQQKRQTV